MTLLLTNETPCRALMVENRKAQAWMPPGGHQEADENPLETAIREAKEETGLDVAAYLPKLERVDDIRSIIPLPARLVEINIPPRGGDPAHYHLDFMYIAHVPKPLDVTVNEQELASVAWLTLGEMKELNIPADIRLVLEEEMRA